jgi:predicted heme/steroid binding protein
MTALLALLALSALTLLRPAPAAATPVFSAQTDLSCTACHESPEGGGTLTPRGQDFRNAGFVPPPEGTPSPWRQGAWFGLGLLHVAAGVLWFGSIFYVHLFIGPRSLTGGLPKGERILGLSSVLIVGLTGVGLSILRLGSLAELWTTTFGIVWLVKVSAFLVMLGIAITTTGYINRKLKQAGAKPAPGAAGQGPAEPNPVAQADGQEGRPAHVVADGQLYDVSASRLWKNGKHMGRHQAGQDLSEALAAAPHGPEVLERVPHLGPAPAPAGEEPPPPALARLFLVLTYSALACVAVVLICLAWWRWGPALVQAAPTWRVDLAPSCLGCHQSATPAMHADWLNSQHARARVSCLHCHQATENDPARSLAHDKVYAEGGSPWAAAQYRLPIKALVSPADCARCHPRAAAEFARSKHAQTWDIMWKVDPWLRAGLNSELERASGCYHCHGSKIAVKDGRLDPATWPNVGVGRLNPDGSKGSCAACHTRHLFSVAEARQPQTCGQCHLGPDHPQKEIYAESKHGAIQAAEGHEWNYDAPPGLWRAGRDYRTPTCAACHMSATARAAGSHDVTERLSWELQAPLTVRPQEFAPWPAPGDWRAERAKMQNVCRDCHGQAWVEDHFAKLDAVVDEYNQVYYLPAKAKLDELAAKGLLDPKSYFRTPLFTEFYELWHHEGRRARMGTAMMAPDYAWWHGFYECKKRLLTFTRDADRLLATGEKAYTTPTIPGGMPPQP